MVVTIGCRDERIRAGAGTHAREESNRLQHYFRQILEVEWRVTHERHEFIVVCTLHTAADKHVAEARADSLHSAFLEASRVIQAQQRRAKRRRIGDRHANPPLLAVR